MYDCAAVFLTRLLYAAYGLLHFTVLSQFRAGEVIAPRKRGEESPSSAGQGGPETGQGATPWKVPQKRRPPARVRVKRWG